MAIRKRRGRRGRSPRVRDDREEERRDHATRPGEDELRSRLDAVSSRFARPPTPDELRAAFGRKPAADRPAQSTEDFAATFPADSLFVPTIDDPVEIPSETQDRSKNRGDYYYDPEDAWAVLGVKTGAPWADIAAAHRKLAKVHHPDRLLDAPDDERAASEAAMREINVAYSLLRRLTGN